MVSSVVKLHWSPEAEEGCMVERWGPAVVSRGSFMLAWTAINELCRFMDPRATRNWKKECHQIAATTRDKSNDNVVD